MLLTLAVEEEYCRGPHHVEAVKPGWVFLYMSLDGKEVLPNELSSSLIFVRLGLQPSTRSSSRSRTEIQENSTGVLLRCGQGLINGFAPVDAHHSPPLRRMLSRVRIRRLCMKIMRPFCDLR